MEESTLTEESTKLNGDAAKPENVAKTEDSDIMEQIIVEVGEMGTYQRWLFVSLMPFFVFFCNIYSVQMFIAATPQQHWCKVPELQHLDINMRRNLSIPGAADGPDWDRCRVYDANWTLVLETLVPPNTTHTRPCEHGWEFLYEDIPYITVVSEREWVCDRAGNAPLAQSVFFLGSFIGCGAFGWMGDKFGRLPTLIASNLVAVLGSLLTVFTRGLWDFTLARFIVGLANDSCAIMLYLIVMEYVGTSHRTWVTNMSLAVFMPMSCVLMVLLALWLRDWRTLVLVTSLPMIGVILAPWFIPESARWLVSKGKIDKAVKVLRKFERVNKTKISEASLNKFIASSKANTSEPESLKDLSKSSLLRNSLIILVVVGMISNLGLDAVLRMSEAIGTSFFVTFTLSSLAEVPALLLVILLLDRVGRRNLIVTTLAITSVLSVICGFTNSGVFQLALAVCMRLAVNMAISAHFQLTSETIPTGMRAGGNAIVHLAIYLAIAASPFVVFSGRFWSPMPLLIIGGLCVLASALSLLLPETNGKPMPQTIQDAEKLIREGAIWKKSTKKLTDELQTVEMVTMLPRKKDLP